VKGRIEERNMNFRGEMVEEGEKSAESLIPKGRSKYTSEDVDGDDHDNALNGAREDA